MTPYTLNIEKAMFRQLRRAISIIILVAFITTSVKSPVYAQTAQDQMPRLPAPGVMIHLSPEFTPAHLQGLTIHPDNALQFDFLIYRGDEPLNLNKKKEQYTKLIKYFLASLTIPDEDQWVNLSPYEKNRIIKDNFGKTEMGRDLLAQDYILKQITSSLIYPEDNLGRKFWDKVYERAWKEYHSSDIPVNTFNKVWIIPDEAAVYESGNSVYILRNHLKVMLEEDYLSLQKHNGIPKGEAISKKTINDTHTIGSDVIRKIILPELEKEVNEGKNFANLRQIYSGMILATWYKHVLKESLLGKVYANQSKVKGVDQNPKNNEAIYQQYLKAFKKGVFNYIKEDIDKYTNETIPRKYFSGGMREYAGMVMGDAAMSGYRPRKVLILTPQQVARLPEDILRTLAVQPGEGRIYNFSDMVAVGLRTTMETPLPIAWGDTKFKPKITQLPPARRIRGHDAAMLTATRVSVPLVEEEPENQAMSLLADLSIGDDILKRIEEGFHTQFLSDPNKMTVDGNTYGFNTTKNQQVAHLGPLFFVPLTDMHELQAQIDMRNWPQMTHIMDIQHQRIIQENLRGVYQQYPRNIIFIPPFSEETPEVALNFYTSSVLAGLLANVKNIKGKTFVDLGAGSGILSLVALALGASKVILVEKSHFYSNLSRKLLELHHYKEGEDFVILERDLVKDGSDIISEIKRIEHDPEHLVAVNQMGPWLFYAAPFEASQSIIDQLRPPLIIAGGFAHPIIVGNNSHLEVLDGRMKYLSSQGYKTDKYDLPDSNHQVSILVAHIEGDHAMKAYGEQDRAVQFSEGVIRRIAQMRQKTNSANPLKVILAGTGLREVDFTMQMLADVEKRIGRILYVDIDGYSKSEDTIAKIRQGLRDRNQWGWPIHLQVKDLLDRSNSLGNKDKDVIVSQNSFYLSRGLDPTDNQFRAKQKEFVDKVSQALRPGGLFIIEDSGTENGDLSFIENVHTGFHALKLKGLTGQLVFEREDLAMNSVVKNNAQFKRNETNFTIGQTLSRKDVQSLGDLQYPNKYRFEVAQNPKRRLLVIEKTLTRGNVLEIVLLNSKNFQNPKGLGQYIGGRQFFMGYSGATVENSVLTNIITKLRSYHRGDLDDKQFLKAIEHMMQEQLIPRSEPVKMINVSLQNQRIAPGIPYLNAAMKSQLPRTVQKTDGAMNSPSNTGGIDLNSANLNLQIKRDGRGVPLPLALQNMAQLSHIKGFVPDIIEIKPAVNIPILNELQQKLQPLSV